MDVWRLTGTVLRVTLVLRMEIVESIRHYILGVDSFLCVSLKEINKKTRRESN